MDYKNKYLKYKLKYLKKKGGMDLWNFLKKYEDKDIYDDYDSDIFYENLYNEITTKIINPNNIVDIKSYDKYVFLISDFVYTLIFERNRNIDDDYIKNRNIINKLQYKIDYKVLFSNIIDLNHDFLINDNDEYPFYRNIIIQNSDNTKTLYIIFPAGLLFLVSQLENIYNTIINPNLINIVSHEFDEIVIGGYSSGAGISYYVLPYLIDILKIYKPSFDPSNILQVCLGSSRMDIEVMERFESYYNHFNFKIIDIININILPNDKEIYIDNRINKITILNDSCNHKGQIPSCVNPIPYYCFNNTACINNSYENVNNADHFYFCSNSNHYDNDSDIKYCLNDLNKYHSHNRINNLLLDSEGNFYKYNKEKFFLKYGILLKEWNKKISKTYLNGSHDLHSIKRYVDNLIKYKY